MKRSLLSLSLLIGLAVAGMLGCGEESVEELHAKGKEAFENRDYAQAREYYLQAITEKTTDRDLLFDCAMAYRRDFFYDSAMYYLKRADLLHPEDREINQQIREVGIALGDWKNAIDAIDVLAETGDGYEPYFAELADLWTRQGHEGRAFYWARKALTQNPDNPALYMQTATWAAKFDSMGVALDLLDTAIARFGPSDDFLVSKALFLSYDGQHRKAETVMRTVIERDSIPNPAYQLNLARILEASPQQQKKQEALDIYYEIRDVLAGRFPIDSLIQALEKQL